MKFYDLETEFNFGKYQGKTLQEIAKIDPEYLNTCALNEQDFFITAPVIEDLQGINPAINFSAPAIQSLIDKHNQWKTEMGIEDEDDEETYAYFDEQAWKDEFGLPEDDEAEDILSLEAASLAAEVTGEFPTMANGKDDKNAEKIADNDFEEEDDSLEEFPFEKFDEDVEDWDGEYDKEDEWN
ncbi:hypothetical protein C3K47_01020 [Solitalea longa]|uniref:Exodeoxyribonuclease X-like C-terminal domain-containing protein n=1 Tax=Solitalea longa TaxID=2079460 RepID=A0A2S5A950_9SPHI|nr:hypothetical protein [Solitalea longa]POY39108.1 hypothetical protein C3K47_01020 [Solitalea longa]